MLLGHARASLTKHSMEDHTDAPIASCTRGKASCWSDCRTQKYLWRSLEKTSCGSVAVPSSSFRNSDHIISRNQPSCRHEWVTGRVLTDSAPAQRARKKKNTHASHPLKTQAKMRKTSNKKNIDNKNNGCKYSIWSVT